MSFAENTKNNLFTRCAALLTASSETAIVEHNFGDFTTETTETTNTPTSVPVPVVRSTARLIPIHNLESE